MSAPDAGSKTALPLAGVRVVDVTRFVAGPLATFFLASMGAEVLSVERPGGEQSRMLAPFGRPEGGASATPVDGGMSVPYLKRGRGKRSVAIALDRPEGRELVRRLAGAADVFVENSRPGVMTRLGLGYEALARSNPALVYASISGYGQTGPRAEAPAMDQAVQAASGLMAKTGFPDGPPIRTGAAVGDYTSAAFAALGVLGALRQRDATGRGQQVDLAMLDVLTALVWDEPVDHYADAGLPVRTGNADPRGAPINVYPARDGWVAVTLTTSEQWRELVVLLGRTAWADDLPTIRERAQHASEIDDAFAAWSRTLPAVEVERLLVGLGIPASVVRDPIAARDDAQLAHRGLLEPLHHPAATAPSGFLGPRLPIAFSGRADRLPAAEQLGTSTHAVLSGWLGLDEAELEPLRDAGVIATRGGATVSERYVIRRATPADYDAVIGVVDAWWGRPVSDALDRLFFDHFFTTSSIVEARTTDHAGRPVAFLVAFLSPSLPDEAYIHFVGVDPVHRGAGLARRLYEDFFALAAAAGRTRVKAITASVNRASIAFHEHMGFTVRGPIVGYNQPGTAHMEFARTLPPPG